MYGQQQQQPGLLDQIRGMYHCGFFVAEAWATTLRLFLRRNFGVEYFGLPQATGLIVLCLYVAVTTPEGQMFPFAVMVLIMFGLLILHRLTSVLSYANPDRPHSHYDGWPLVCDLLPIREEWAKLYVEPFVAIVIGYLIMIYVHEPLGYYVIIGGIAIRAVAWESRRLRRLTAEAVRDAAIEQHQLTEEYGAIWTRPFGSQPPR